MQRGGSSYNDAVISAACRTLVMSPLRMSDSGIPLGCVQYPTVSALVSQIKVNAHALFALNLRFQDAMHLVGKSFNASHQLPQATTRFIPPMGH